ncbi:hypothetical protein V5O48_008105 [Marasmius crinis-equi]|uniref:Chromatin structure-remodeling complex subunit rsc1 n=1 Tax=Marasmius crinis-equi TaxID=585013 RepID=A0ABR3FEY1_9AGAR
MPIKSDQKAAIESVINAITSVNAPGRGRRNVASMFMDLVDRTEWPEYFEIIPEPRCINNIKASLEKNRYKDPLDVYTDLSLVFWNAMFYNEESSQIAHDAENLKKALETEWKKHTTLPPPRSTSPPPQSAQKVHKTVEQPPPPAVTAAKPTAPSQPAQPVQTAVPTAVAQPKPVAVSTPAPVARTSRAARQTSPEIEVDIGGMSPEPEDIGAKLMMQGVTQRDSVSEEIVNQLERSLPRWPGFSEQGWLEQGNQSVYSGIVHAVKSHKDVMYEALSSSFSLSILNDFFSTQRKPACVSAGRRTRSHEWTNCNIDGKCIDIFRRLPAYLPSQTPLSLKIIENRVRSNEYATPQDFDKDMARLFEKARRWLEPSTEPYGNVLLLQRLYQALASSEPPPGPPYSSTTNFASLRAGPGNVKPVHGDGEGVPGVTSHRVLTRDKKFVDEVHYKGWSVKLADWLHLSNPDDPSRPIIAQVFRCWVSEEEHKKGQVGVTVSWYYRPEQTYHPPNRLFWEREVFKTSHFAEHPLPDIIEKIACQFTARHIRGRPRAPFWWPGFPLYVCDSRYNDRDRIFVRIKNWNSCIPEEVRKSDEFMPIYPFERTVYPRRLASPFLPAMGKGMKGPGGLLDLPAEDAEVVDPSGKRTRRPLGDAGHSKPLNLSTNQPVVPATTQQYVQQPLVNQTAQYYQPPKLPPTNSKPVVDRTVLTAAGGSALGNNVNTKKLPSETTRHFDRDPQTNEVLWFSSPPVNVAPAPAPRHSLAYLHFLAKKRKQEESESTEGEDSSPPAKKNRFLAPPSMLETLAALASEEPRVV